MNQTEVAAVRLQEDFVSRLLSYVGTDKEIAFCCIGTDRSTGDAFGPLVGTELQRRIPGLAIYGTLNNPVHAVNIRSATSAIYKNHRNPCVIAVDAALGKFDHVGIVEAFNKPLRPGAAVDKQLAPVGDVSVTGIVNVSGFMEYLVLQNTRLGFVMQMVDETVNAICGFLEARQSLRLVAAGQEAHP